MRSGQTAVTVAAAAGHLDMLTELLGRGAAHTTGAAGGEVRLRSIGGAVVSPLKKNVFILYHVTK